MSADTKLEAQRPAFEQWLIAHQRAAGFGARLKDSEMVTRDPLGRYHGTGFDLAFALWCELRSTPPAQAQGVEVVADVPIHPRQGPLWANVRPRGADTPMPSYPMRPLMYADHPSTLKRLSPEQIMLLSGNCYDIGGENPVVVFARAIESASAAHNGMGVE